VYQIIYQVIKCKQSIVSTWIVVPTSQFVLLIWKKKKINKNNKIKDKGGVFAIWSVCSEQEFRSNMFWLHNVSGSSGS